MSYSPLAFVESLSFVRYGGTAAELQAAKMIQEEIEKAGGSSELESFAIPASTYHSHVVKVIAPYEKALDVTPFGMCGSIPAPGLDLKFLYADRCTERDLLGYTDLSDTIVMINAMNIDAYKLLCQRKAAAIFVIMGKYYHKNEEAGIYARNHRPKYLEYGNIPTFYLNAREATELVRSEASLIHLELEQEDGEAASQNVVAVIEGIQRPEESIVLTGHYDSLSVGPGAWDNATGSAALLGVYRYFLANPPKRTMRFIWCGSEEQGLLGSKAYIAQHEDLLGSLRLCFNFDMCGTVLGPNGIVVTGSKELEIFADQFCRETGYSAEINAKVHSSDSAPFADLGVPGISIYRGTSTSEIHTCYDQLFPIGEQALLRNIDFACQIISRAVNASVPPVDTGMPDNVKEELDQYFQRDK